MASRAALMRGEARREAILRFIEQYSTQHGFSPTFAEIGEAVGLTSRNATRLHLLRLRDEGHITIHPRMARSITLRKSA